MTRVVALTVLVLGSCVSLLSGQTYHAGLRGVVQDAGGGVLPGATVAISDDSTGFTRVSVANEVGQYAFTDVQPAVYTVRAELDGFAPFEHPSGTVAAIATNDGIVGVGRLSGGEPHLLVGHKGAVDLVAISPDLRWVATTGEDNTLRLWPMPDLSKPPLQTLPHDELLAKLRSLTNLRVVRDPSSPNGWKLEIGPFPGWKEVPTW